VALTDDAADSRLGVLAPRVPCLDSDMADSAGSRPQTQSLTTSRDAVANLANLAKDMVAGAESALFTLAKRWKSVLTTRSTPEVQHTGVM
jgi:hypothetical protein